MLLIYIIYLMYLRRSTVPIPAKLGVGIVEVIITVSAFAVAVAVAVATGVLDKTDSDDTYTTDKIILPIVVK